MPPVSKKPRRGGDWSVIVPVGISAGIRSGMRSDSTSEFTIELTDKTSGKFIVEFTLSGDEFLKALRGTMFDIEAEVAKPEVAALWGHVPVRDAIHVPTEVTRKWWGDEAKQRATDWFEEQPGSARFDEWWVTYDSNQREHLVHTITYVPLEQWERERALIEESEDIDYEDDGMDDD